MGASINRFFMVLPLGKVRGVLRETELGMRVCCFSLERETPETRICGDSGRDFGIAA
jgi:hypothetical protein